MLNQDTHSPKTSKTPNAKKRLLKKPPPSIQVNSEPLQRFNSDPVKSAKLSESPSPRFYNRTDRSPRKSFLKLAHQISDVFSSKQLKQAIDSTRSVNDRLKMLDYVLIQRKQKKDQEDQERLERAAPVIKHFHQNVKMKITASQQGSPVSRFRSLCQDLKTEGTMVLPSQSEIPSLGAAGSITAFLPTVRLETLETQETERLKRHSIDVKGPIKYYSKDKRRSHQPLLGIPLKADMHTEPAPSIALLEPPETYPNLVATGDNGSDNLPTSPRRNSFVPIYSKSQILDKFTSIMGQKVKNDLQLDDKKYKNNGWKPPVLHYVKKSFQDQAKKTLEEDLCRYLLTNAEEDQGIRRTFKTGKRTQIKQIEQNAVTRFESLTKKKSFEIDPVIRSGIQSPKNAPSSPRVYKGGMTIARQVSK